MDLSWRFFENGAYAVDVHRGDGISCILHHGGTETYHMAG